MSFTIEDYHDLAKLLAEHPEWRSELRSLVLSDDLLSLPETIKEIIKIQKRTEERFDRLEERQKQFEENQRQFEENQRQFEERQKQFEERQKQFEERLSKLEIAFQELVEKVALLIEQVKKLTENQISMSNTIGNMKGKLLELTYRDKAYGYFGHLLRHVKVVNLSKIDEVLEKTLAPSEFREVFRMDLLLKGQVREISGRPEVFLVLEVSSVVDGNDVDRAWQRAGLIRRAGYKVMPVAAGEEVTPEAEEYAKQQNVLLMQDGQAKFWKEAISAWVTN